MKIGFKTVYFTKPIIALVTVLVFSCSDKKGGGSINKSLLPEAAGEIAEVLVVIEGKKWEGPVGQFIKETLGAPIPGLPQDEPMFTLRPIDPLKMNNVLKSAKNIVYVTLLDDTSRAGLFMRNNITPESIERINNEPDLFMFTKQDEYALGQEITHLFGTNEQSLVDNLNKNKERLIYYFNKTALKRTSDKLYEAGEKNNLNQKLSNDHGFSLRIPAGYEIAKEEDRFVWLRFLDPEVDKSLFVYYQNYTTEHVFKQDSLLAYRDKITSKYLRDVEKPAIYITHQNVLSMVSKPTTFYDQYAMESIGLWRVSDNSAGGPYKSYAFVDPSNNRLYYMESFVRAPGQDKREPMRELQVIMETFKTESNQ